MSREAGKSHDKSLGTRRAPMKSFVKYFLRGLLVIVPITITAYVIYVVFVKVDRLLRIPIPGVGFILTILFVVLVGYLAGNIIMRKFLEVMEALFIKVPFVKIVYSSIKDLLSAFVGEKRSFDRPVVVSPFPGSGLKITGFVTRDSLESFGLSDHVSVYFPQSYNFAGNIFIVPREQVRPLDIESADIMAFIVSGGVSGHGV
jgi:uncharacterized membrane protein